MVTRDVAAAKVGQVLYTSWCEAAGKVLDDGTIARLDEDVFRLTSADPGLRWLESNAVGLEVAIEDVSESTVALALQGPASRAILQELVDIDLAGLKYFRITAAKLRESPVTISRTGYTGDLGYEIWLAAGDALGVWDALIEAGVSARDHARRNTCARRGADRGGIDAHGRGLRFRAQGVDRSADFLALRARSRVDRESRRRSTSSASRRSPREASRGPQWQFVGLEVDWDALERCYAEVGLAPQPAVRRPGARARRCTRTASRRDTRRAAAGRRSSRSPSRSRICSPAGRRPARRSRWK